MVRLHLSTLGSLQLGYLDSQDFMYQPSCSLLLPEFKCCGYVASFKGAVKTTDLFKCGELPSLGRWMPCTCYVPRPQSQTHASRQSARRNSVPVEYWLESCRIGCQCGNG